MATHMNDPALLRPQSVMGEPVLVQRVSRDLPFKLIGGFAAACFIAALGTDIVYTNDPDMLWVTFSVWAITIGLLVAGLATLVGLIDRVVTHRFGALAPTWPYLLGFALAVVVEIFNAFVHSRDAYQAVVPEGIALSFLAVALLVLTPIFARTYRRNRTINTRL